MINDLKAEIEKRTGLPASTVDQVLSALGELVSERYPQYAGIIGGVLGIPTTGGGATGTSGASGGIPDLGGLFGGQNQSGGQSNTGGSGAAQSR